MSTLLDEMLDRLNGEFFLAEDLLRSLNIPEQAEVPLGNGTALVWCQQDHPRTRRREWSLGYRNANGNVAHITTVSKDIRTNAAHKVDWILASLRSAEASRLKEVQGAINALAKLRETA